MTTTLFVVFLEMPDMKASDCLLYATTKLADAEAYISSHAEDEDYEMSIHQIEANLV